MRFVAGRRGGRPVAEVVAVFAPGAALAIAEQLRGWYVRCREELGAELLALGAQPSRHAHRMLRDLTVDPPPVTWERPDLPPGIRLELPDRSAAEVFPACAAAFPADHPDRRHDRRPPGQAEADFADLWEGRELGPQTRAGALAVDAAGAVLGGIVVTQRDEGPWIGTVFRRPGDDLRRLGEAMTRRALALTAAEGGAAIGLAVTEGNPARRLYDRLGFAVVESALTVWIPPGDPRRRTDGAAH